MAQHSGPLLLCVPLHKLTPVLCSCRRAGHSRATHGVPPAGSALPAPLLSQLLHAPNAMGVSPTGGLPRVQRLPGAFTSHPPVSLRIYTPCHQCPWPRHPFLGSGSQHPPAQEWRLEHRGRRGIGGCAETAEGQGRLRRDSARDSADQAWGGQSLWGGTQSLSCPCHWAPACVRPAGPGREGTPLFSLSLGRDNQALHLLPHRHWLFWRPAPRAEHAHPQWAPPLS